MTSADFSQFVVTTANETACETSPLKVRTLSLHVPATFTGTSSNFWTSAFLAALSVFPSLICDFCPSGQRFACSFLQIPPCDGHPCCSAMCFVVAYAHSGLSPVRARPWRANKKYRHFAKKQNACMLANVYVKVNAKKFTSPVCLSSQRNSCQDSGRQHQRQNGCGSIALISCPGHVSC